MFRGETQMQPCCTAQQCVHENLSMTSRKSTNHFLSDYGHRIQRPFFLTNVWRTAFIHFTVCLCATNCRSCRYFFRPYSVKESIFTTFFCKPTPQNHHTLAYWKRQLMNCLLNYFLGIYTLYESWPFLCIAQYTVCVMLPLDCWCKYYILYGGL